MLAGATASLSFAPAEFWPLMAPSLAVLFFVVARSQTRFAAAVAGFAFGLAFFGIGLRWIFGALGGYIGLPLLAAAALSALLCAALSLYPALVAALSWRDGFSRTPEERARDRATILLSLAGLWSFGEWLRGGLFGGFPWLAAGYSQTAESPLHGWLPIFGIAGVNLFTALTAALLALLFSRPWNAPRTAAAVFALAAIWGGGALAARLEWTRPAGEISVSLLQGNVRQELKWREGEVERALRDYLRMAEESPGRWIILPETALPMRLSDVPPEILSALRGLAAERDGAVLAGVFAEEGGELFNAAAALGDFPAADYRKRHLTPYGEYLPFAEVLRPILLAADIPYNSLAAGGRAAAMSLPGGEAAVSICYEDIFPAEWRTQLPRAGVLINITNDGWFDGSAMPRQHFRMSQARAAEFGRGLARATNTGITALTDHRGRTISELPESRRGALHGTITLRAGATPFVRYGELPALALSAMLIFGAMLWRRTPVN